MDNRQNPIDHIYGPALPDPFLDPVPVSSQYASTSTLGTAHALPVEAQLHQENAQLRAQIAVLQVQRQAEKKAYNLFAIQAHSINKTIPSDQKTPEYSSAYQAVVDVSRTYVEVQRQTQQHPPRPSQPQTYNPTSIRRDSVLDTTIDCELDRQRTQHEIAEVKAHLKSQLNSFILSLRSVNHRISSFTPVLHAHNTGAPPTNLSVSNPRQRLAVATRTLETNISSHTNFLATYLNGRYDALGKELRPKLKALLEPFFADPGDARVLMNRIIGDVRDVIMVERAEMRLLSGDLVEPVGEVVRALEDVLEEVVRSLEG